MATFFPTNWSIQLASCPYFMGKCRGKHGLGRFLWHSFLFLSFFLLPEDVETSFDIFANFCFENIPSSPTYAPNRKFQSLLQNVFSITVKMSRNL